MKTGICGNGDDEGGRGGWRRGGGRRCPSGDSRNMSRMIMTAEASPPLGLSAVVLRHHRGALAVRRLISCRRTHHLSVQPHSPTLQMTP